MNQGHVRSDGSMEYTGVGDNFLAFVSHRFKDIITGQDRNRTTRLSDCISALLRAPAMSMFVVTESTV